MAAADAHARRRRPAPTDAAPARFFFGWAVVAGAFVMLGVSSGLGFYNMTVYLRALATEHGFSVGAMSGATAAFFFVSGLAGIAVANLISRFDARLTVATGAVLAAGSLVLLGAVEELWQVYVVYILFGLGFAASSLVPGITVVTRWFARRRSLAVSVASTGLSAGGILITPLCASLINRHGLATVAPWLAVAYAVGVVPIAAALLRPTPAAMGLWPDGDPAPADPAGAAASGVPARVAFGSRFFLAVTGAYVLIMLAQVGGIAHLFNLVSERVDEVLAARAVSVMAVASVVGRLTGGWIVTRLSMRGFTAALVVGQCGAMMWLGLARGGAPLLVGCVLFGLTVGNLLMLHPLLLAEAFGVRDYGRIYARSQFVMTIGVAVGPALIGVVHDVVGGYTLAFVVAAVASLVAAGTLLSGGPVDAEAGARRVA